LLTAPSRTAKTGPVLLALSTMEGTGGINYPALLSFGWQNPVAPLFIRCNGPREEVFSDSLSIRATAIRAFVPTYAMGDWGADYGDVLAVDVSNLSSPKVLDTLELPVDPTYGGANPCSALRWPILPRC